MKTLLISLLFSGIIVGDAIDVIPEKSKVVVLGTSSLHDWESVVESYTINGNIEATQITNLEALFNVESIKSGKSIMDSKAQDALEAEKYPNIIFKAAKLNIAGGKVTGQGTLTIAGKSKPMQFVATSKQNSNGDMMVKGSTKIKMTEFDIEPPTAMFGTLTTGDEVTVDYEILLNQ